MYFNSVSEAHKNRLSRRSKAAGPHQVPDIRTQHSLGSSEAVCSAQTTRLNELLSPVSCIQPPSLKPRPPLMPKVRERNTCVSNMVQPEASTRGRDSLMLVQTARDTHTSPQKHRSHKETTSERTTPKERTRTPSLRSSLSSGHKGSSRKSQSATRAPVSPRVHKESDKEQRRRRNEAARIIQRAWRRLACPAL